MDSRSYEGLVFVIHPGPSGDAARASEPTLERLRTRIGTTVPLETRTLGGCVWGFVPFRSEGPDRLTRATHGPLECVLRGDPVWLEPESPRACDAESFLSVWEARGSATAPLVDNLSLALVADSRDGALHIFTDRTGGIRLFEVEAAGAKVLISSYALACRISDDRAIDADALACFFHLGYFPLRRTALRGVSMHPAAAWTRVDRGGTRTKAYWTPRMRGSFRTDERELEEGAIDAFDSTVREYSAGHGPMVLAMTAGLDSRTVAASLLKQRIPFRTYTHGFPDCWEGRRVSSIVERHEIPHRFVPLVEEFTGRLESLALEAFEATEGEIGSIEKCHLIHVLSSLAASGDARHAALLLGGGAGMLKGTNYRLLKDAPSPDDAGIRGFVEWNLEKHLPDIFAASIPARDPRPLRDFVREALAEAGEGTFFQRLDYLYLVRYRRWAGVVKNIYRRFFPVREPFVSARLLDYLFPLDPKVKKAKLPHFAILERDYPSLRFDLTNKMTPAVPFGPATWYRFLPSVPWRMKQVIRGFSRRYLPREIFPLVDYVDYSRWIRLPSGRHLIEEGLDPARMKSGFLYEEAKLSAWLRNWRETGQGSFSLLDRIWTLERFFHAIET
jgi:hypothetical protein